MIIIIGGSWGIGEWHLNELSGPGIGQYFAFEDRVINLCRSGLSAKQQLEDLTHLLTKYQHDDADKFYWLVHNPLTGVPTQDIYHKQTSLIESAQNILDSHLDTANTVAKNNNLILHLIGCACDLDTITKEYSNLRIVVPSWGRLLDDKYPTSIFAMQAEHMTDLKAELEVHRPDLLGEYRVISGKGFSKRRTMTKLDTMFKSFHPSSHAHRILKEHLRNNT